MSKIKLTGSNSGYVEISSAADAGNLTLALPTSGTVLLSNTDNVFTGITTTGQLDINGSIDVSSTSVFNDDLTLTGASYNVVWDKSDNQLEFGDNAKLSFGASADLQIYHNGTESWIKNNTSTLNILNDGTTQIKNNADNQYVATFVTGNASNSGCRLYFNNSEKIRTTNTGTVTNGICTATSFSGDGSSLTNLGELSYRNLLINGDFFVFQRYLPGSMITVNSGSNVYCMDRWYGRGESSKGVFTFHQHDITSQAQGTHVAARVNITTTSTPSTNDVYKIAQRIEGRHIHHLAFGTSAAKTLELSFITKSSVQGTHSGALTNSGQSRSFPFTYTIINQDTWEQKSITIPGDTSGTWDVGTGIGMELIFDMGTAESNYRLPAGSWHNGRAEGADGAVQLITQSSANWYVAKVQLEIGTTATAFEQVPFVDQQQRCKRYYQRFSAYGDHHHFGVARAESNTARTGLVIPVPMRASPTVACNGHRTFTGDAGYNSESTSTPSVLAGWVSDSNIYTVDFPGHSLTHNRMYCLMSRTTSTNALTLDSEL